MADLAIHLEYEGQGFRVGGRQDRPMMPSVDVCRVLGIANATQAAQVVPPEEKGLCLIETPGGPQRMLCLTKAGVYRLVMRSDKPAARKFQDWLVQEVLPSIEQHGCYPPPMMTVPSGETAMVLLDHKAKAFVVACVSEAIDNKQVATRSDLHAATEAIKTEIGRAGGRRELTEQTKRRHRGAISMLPFQGRCPICMNNRIVDPATEEQTGACRFDHFYSNKKNGFDATWPICAGCHDALDGEPDNGLNTRRKDAESAFQVYHLNAKRWSESPGDQLLFPISSERQ